MENEELLICTFSQLKEDEMDRACETYAQMKNAYNILVAKTTWETWA
jgi:hypothetical protein